jgi:hypothetical protein
MTPYALSKASEGRISLSTAYRLVRLRGRVANFDADALAAPCDVLKIEPGELPELTPKRGRG